MLKIAIAEDDKTSREMLEQFIGCYGEENKEEFLIRSFENGSLLLASLSQGFDIILLDIEMPVMSGIVAAKAIRRIDEEVVLMFITNMSKYAISGYEVGALDFVLKPVSYFSFKMKFKRAISRASRMKKEEILLNLPDGVVKLDISDIYYVEVVSRQLHYYTYKGEYVIKGALKNAEEGLKPYHFEKCNYWYLVNLRHVEKISHNSVTVGGTELEMSRRMRPTFLEALNAYMGGN